MSATESGAGERECDHDWVYFAGVGAVGFEDGYECRKCSEVR